MKIKSIEYYERRIFRSSKDIEITNNLTNQFKCYNYFFFFRTTLILAHVWRFHWIRKIPQLSGRRKLFPSFVFWVNQAVFFKLILLCFCLLHLTYNTIFSINATFYLQINKNIIPQFRNTIVYLFYVPTQSRPKIEITNGTFVGL